MTHLRYHHLVGKDLVRTAGYDLHLRTACAEMSVLVFNFDYYTSRSRTLNSLLILLIYELQDNNFVLGSKLNGELHTKYFYILLYDLSDT
jgi:hypothetical protein